MTVLTKPRKLMPESSTSGTTPVSWRLPVFEPGRMVRIADNSGTHLKKPILLNVERTESNNWLATHSTILTHGYGESAIDAARNFHSMLIDLFIELVESEDMLAPHLQEELDYLREIIIEESVL